MPHVLLDELENCFLDALRFCCPLISLIPATFKCVFRTFISLKRSSQTILHWFYFQILELTFEVLNFPKRKACVPPLNDPLPFLSATTAAERIRNKTLRSVDLVSAYVRRTEEVNCLINAISEENFDEALSNAAKVDSMLASADAATTKRICKSRPLLGVPFCVTDNLAIAGLPVTKGCTERRIICRNDADIVRTIKEAGGILLGVCRVSEAMISEEVGDANEGSTKNPFDLRRSAGGSVALGALVSSACTPLAIGADFDGALRRSACANGVFAFTYSNSLHTVGQIFHNGFCEKSFQSELYSTGSMVRFYEDLVLCSKIFDPYSELKKIGLPMKVFYIEEFPPEVRCESPSKQIRRQLREVIRVLEEHHSLPTYRLALRVMKHASRIHKSTFEDFEGAALADFVAKSRGDLGGSGLYVELMKALFGSSRQTIPVLFSILRKRLLKSDNSENRAFQVRLESFRKNLSELLKRENGVLISLSSPTTPRFQNYSLFSEKNVVYTSLWSALALPTLQCPVGFDGCLPMGIQISGAHGSEETILNVARMVTKRFGGWQQPRLTA